MKEQLRIRDDITQVARMVNRLEWMRKQVSDVEKMLRAEASGSGTKPELLKSVHDMDQKMQAVEYKLDFQSGDGQRR